MWGRILIFALAGGLIGFIIWVILQLKKEKTSSAVIDRKAEIRDSIRKDMQIQEQEEELAALRKKLEDLKNNGGHISDN